jgi:hypothetical protein
MPTTEHRYLAAACGSDAGNHVAASFPPPSRRRLPPGRPPLGELARQPAAGYGWVQAILVSSEKYAI